VGRDARKNFMVDAEAVRDLARQRGTSESQAIRDAVEFALAAEQVVSAIERLHDSGGFADFERLYGPGPDEVDAPPASPPNRVRHAC
jgi:hypothetical protein